MVTRRRDDTDLEATGAQDGSVGEVVVVSAARTGTPGRSENRGAPSVGPRAHG